VKNNYGEENKILLFNFIFFSIIIYFSLFEPSFFNFNVNDKLCEKERQVLEIEISGIVTNKFKEEGNHMY
jgi:hypothetical protein